MSDQKQQAPNPFPADLNKQPTAPQPPIKDVSATPDKVREGWPL